jgi:polar amino acid transport system permease protein
MIPTIPAVRLVPLGTLADWGFVLGNAEYLAGGLAITIALTIASILLGFAAGFPAGILEVYGGRYSSSLVANLGVLLRGTPLVVIIIVMFFVVGVSPAFLAATFALGFRSAAYQSQIFRGAIESVSGGQMEAARAVGLSRFQAIRHVVVPQALRRSIPGFQNEFTIVLKDTSIAFAIGLAELLTRSYDLFVQRTTAVLEIVLFISLLYFVLTFGTNRALDALGERFAIPGGEG